MAELLFGHALSLDKWLLGRSVQFLLLDLGYLNLGLGPRSEILRVAAYLGMDGPAVGRQQLTEGGYDDT